VKRALGPMMVLTLGLLFLTGCGGSSSSAPFPPKTKADLKALAQSSQTSLKVVGKDETSTEPKTSVLFVVVPQGLSNRDQVAALLKVMYDNNLETKVGHELGSAVVLGYKTNADVGNRFNAGRAELDEGKNGKRTMIMNANGGGPNEVWKLTY
jgi:hypothetical protein